jgi:hypothetical protein
MVVPGHDSGPTEPSDSVGDSRILGGDDDFADERRLFDLPINEFYQCLSVDFDYWFSGETSGIEACGDDRDGGINLHQKHRTSS